MESAVPVLTVGSVYEAVAWYREVLGFESVYLNEEPGEKGSLDYAVLRNGGAEVHLGLAADMGQPAGQGGCSLHTREFQAAYESAKRARVEFHLELGTIPTGQRTFGIEDPDGNLISLVEARP